MIDGTTLKFCLIGDPVEHSLSPIIMNTLFKKHNLNAIYFTCRVRTENLEEAVKGIKALDIRGFNVTMPHKISVMEYLDEISTDSKIIGAVNTVFNKRNKLIGYNTDWLAMKKILENYRSKILNRCVILGAGGTARASLFAVSKFCNEVVIVNRTYKKALKLVKIYKEFIPNLTAEKFNISTLKKVIPQSDLIINATPLGMDGKTSPIPSEIISSDMIVVDLIYKPLKTPLLKYAEEKGSIIIDGLWILLYQALEGFKIWTGLRPDIGNLRTVLEKVSR